MELSQPGTKSGQADREAQKQRKGMIWRNLLRKLFVQGSLGRSSDLEPISGSKRRGI
jgi:hypothetical protein